LTPTTNNEENNMIDLQQLMNAISAACQNTREGYHLSLGEAAALAKQATGIVRYEDGGSPGSPDSYRGYYTDLAFGDAGSAVLAVSFAVACANASNGTFDGYKGGEYAMKETTALWRAPYGCTGSAIISGHINADGDLILHCKNIN
jgi:hypothetical protein